RRPRRRGPAVAGSPPADAFRWVRLKNIHGTTAFFSAGKRAEPWALYRVAVDGGQPERIGTGAWPSVSPDGRRPPTGSSGR
ncbi:MAG: hypothetical protein ACRD0O_22750, partial [Acidimicrobiia bacterium]